jgi:hypothetical protein
MGATNRRETQFHDVHDKLKGSEIALAELQEIAFPTPAIKVSLARYKLQITKMKVEIARLEKIYVKKRDNAVRPHLLTLNENIADPSYVGSASSEEAYRIAHQWLNAYKASSADLFYQRVQKAVVDYAKLRKDNGE